MFKRLLQYTYKSNRLPCPLHLKIYIYNLSVCMFTHVSPPLLVYFLEKSKQGGGLALASPSREEESYVNLYIYIKGVRK